jgi:tetratricopeptide (TPR) repeat protein
LAQIYELQGLKEEALEIYREILTKNPGNAEAQAAIRRLSGLRRRFEGVNETMRDYFIAMRSDEEFARFEAWLAELEG